MNTEQIIKLARQAGLQWYPAPKGGDSTLLKFAALVAAAEREECAMFCDSAGHHWSGAPSHAIFCVAEAIRARKHIVAANKKPDCTDCECADNEPCKSGIALESGEFIPAEKIADWASA